MAGMLTGADSIADLDVLREGAVGKVLPGVRASSTLGTFLRAFTFGHVRQLGAVATGFLVAVAHLVPLLTAHDDHRDAVTWLDVDDTIRETHGYAKQGVGYGYNKVKGPEHVAGHRVRTEPGPPGQPHHRHQPRRGQQVHFVEGRSELRELSRPGARFRDCSQSVSPGRSPGGSAEKGPGPRAPHRTAHPAEPHQETARQT